MQRRQPIKTLLQNIFTFSYSHSNIVSDKRTLEFKKETARARWVPRKCYILLVVLFLIKINKIILFPNLAITVCVYLWCDLVDDILFTVILECKFIETDEMNLRQDGVDPLFSTCLVIGPYLSRCSD